MTQKSTIGLTLLLLTTQLGITQQPTKAQTPTPAPPTTTTKQICPAQLGNSIETIINRPSFNRVRWGILIQPLSSGQTLYSRDAQKYFTPASNTKLLTTAAALQELGANFRIRTSIYQNSNGVLRVVGRGDPSLGDTQLQALAKQLRQKGITQIQQLIADDSYIQGDIVNPTWQWEDVQSDYGAPVSSFILNENIFSFKLTPQALGKPLQIAWTDSNEERRWRIVNQSTTVSKNQTNYIDVTRDLTGTVLRIQGQLTENSQPYLVTLPVVDPNYYFLRRFRTILATEKISLGQTLVFNGGNNQQEIAAIDSPPLSQLVTEVNVNSNNLYAEALLRALAVKQPRVQNKITANIGLEVLKASLTKLGVDPTSYSLVDGSGLSRRNLLSAEALVQTLRLMATTPAANIYRASLPVAGKTGTLKNRFRNTPAEGIVQAKTGTLTGAVSLAGYVNNAKYEPVVFSIMVNQSDRPASELRQAIDEIVVLLAQLQRC
ncbi:MULTISPECIES: D-alanyl-D-alanine carboxypeptidase/D-alanyl-D-alanine endopeptidase [Calothrix]|uniref:D-alanyl-D-alanine carboxypeptidase/D-alanyl-D-alanine-endopeptidase n=2 Tax=Calothrix TaxID=1186 RepID=A0ABR8A6Y2_9CYAN|nr:MULTISPECIES: D-alanyl-D-alanine carboxypeptidase/D-alanyl-D-alanine-endopeptidase [Calothrix]MBD2195235.1 D-alanyl-D-alanine carboxypeptidase/D-alanyl-D-alanine-endopeptidase [Calothrix parietina FACHB-288]MBD2223794.1 D-alanyl-D-alanine carboxypeptidase/D-alanyl-D-alanine-endopeptidase [Calothrix anomala FACHB-343]